MNGDPFESRRAIRWEHKRLQLGVPNPECIDCHRGDIRYLHRVKPKNRIGLPAGSIICRNCRKRRGEWSEASLKRKRSAFEALGYPDPKCSACGEVDLRTLELHHIASKANSALEVPLCVNCHAVQSDMQEDAPIDFRLPDAKGRPLVMQAAFEFGLGCMFMAVAAMKSLENKSFGVALGLIAFLLFAWCIWNIAADKHFVEKYGADYCEGVPAQVPR